MNDDFEKMWQRMERNTSHDFEKMWQRMKRNARRLRRGGFADTLISVPCKSCGESAQVAIRKFTHKRKPHCPVCGGYLNQEVALQMLLVLVPRILKTKFAEDRKKARNT
jgi:hypothetical protein